MQIENGCVVVEYPSSDGSRRWAEAYPAWQVAITLEVPVESLDYMSLATVVNGKPAIEWIRQLCTPETYALTSWEE